MIELYEEVSLMGFFKKLFGSTPPPPVSPKVKEQYADIQISFVPSERLYKSAREKSEETVSENQQLWIDRYDKKVCPSCGSSLKEAPKQNRKCPECKDQILVRSHFQKKDKKVLLRQDEKDDFEKAKKGYFDERWCVRELTHLQISEEEFMKTWIELGSEFSSFDVMKVLIDRSVNQLSSFENNYPKRMNFERTRKLLYMKNFQRRGFIESAYDVLLSLIVFDFYLEFNRSDRYNELIESIEKMDDSRFGLTKHLNDNPYSIVFSQDLLEFKKALNLSDSQIKQDFLKTNEESYSHLKTRIDLNAAWNSIEEVLLKNDVGNLETI